MPRKSFGFSLSIAFAALYVVMVVTARSTSAADDPRGVPVIGPEIVDAMKVLPGGLTALPEVPVPADNAQSPAKVDLGKRLFFDTRLSGDFKSSCSSCHSPDKAFTDGLPRSKGFNGVLLRRNSPTVLNAAFNTAQFWDGRAATLDEQCKGPLLSPDEMNMVDETHLIARLNAVPEYRRDFQTVFGAGPSLDNVARAVAAFERTLVTPNARFDQYAGGDKKALTDQEKRGLVVFFGRGACSECHKGANFTDNLYHNLGSTAVKGNPDDLGRFEITRKEEDRGAFKTPSIRNAALTAPYMHDGSSATLEDVVEFYDRGGGDGPNKDKLIYKLNLTKDEKSDLVVFLEDAYRYAASCRCSADVCRRKSRQARRETQVTIKPKAAGIALVLAIAVAFAFAVWGFEFHSRNSAEAGTRVPVPRPQTTGKANDDLRQVMEAKVHKDYTAMSFTIWHDRPLTKEKMDAIAEASSHIVQAAQGLETYEATYKQQGWSAQDMKFFDDKRLQLSHVAEELNRAAKSHDESQVVSFFMHMDNTCQSCHKRFRPDLSWT